MTSSSHMMGSLAGPTLREVDWKVLLLMLALCETNATELLRAEAEPIVKKREDALANFILFNWKGLCDSKQTLPYDQYHGMA